MKPEEAQLIEACLKNDQKAYRRLYDLYARRMYGVCRRYSRSDAAAEDALHDGFITVFENLHKLRNVDSLDAWICRVMVFSAINAYRKDMHFAPLDETVESDSTSGDEILDSIDAEIIVKAMQQLPDGFRTALNLCEVEGYSIEDAATEMGVKPSSMRSTLSRARRLLVEMLKKRKF